MSKRDQTYFFLLLGLVILSVAFLKVALGPTLGLLILAMALAYLTYPIVRKLERLGVNRRLTVILIFSIFSGGIVLFLTQAIPFLISQTQELVRDLPEILRRFLGHIKPIAERLGLGVHLEFDDVVQYLTSNFQNLVQEFGRPVLNSLSRLIINSTSVLLWILNLFLFPVFFFFLIQDYEIIWTSFKKWIPRSKRDVCFFYAQQFDRVLSGYIRGQVIVCFCLATIYSIGFGLVGLRFGILLGVVAGLLSMIPYVGASTAAVGSLLLAIGYSEPIQIYIGLGIVIAIAQALEGLLLTPRLVGNQVGLPPLAVMLALIAGANLAGFFGMMLAIPVAGMMKIVALDLFHKYQASRFYRE